MQEDENFVEKAFRAGIKSYLFKSAETEELIFAIRQVAKSQPYLCAGLSERLIRKIGSFTAVKSTQIVHVEFSDREMDVLRLIADGYTNEEAADKLFTSKRTVEGHRQAMIDKTGSRNSLALITFAMRNGLLA